MRYEIYIFVLFLLRVGLSQTTVENFGPYTWDWLKYETCTGPKRGECGAFRVVNTQNMSDVIYIVDMAKDCPVTKAKVTISTLRNNGKTANKLWNYRTDQPCQHFVLGPLLMDAFKLNNTCRINKGHYEIHVNVNEISTKFLGSSFFYGIYAFKVMAFNSENNLFCQSSVMAIKKP